ncbi:MAG: hypothetical protein AAGB04_25525 [Pseudomonadota bacterium]
MSVFWQGNRVARKPRPNKVTAIVRQSEPLTAAASGGAKTNENPMQNMASQAKPLARPTAMKAARSIGSIDLLLLRPN